jgi:hypothetical protein
MADWNKKGKSFLGYIRNQSENQFDGVSPVLVHSDTRAMFIDRALTTQW